MAAAEPRAGVFPTASLVVLLATAAIQAPFLRPRDAKAPKVWGVENGIAVGVHPDFRGAFNRVCPRGLIRIGLLRGGKPVLVNFVAVEPVVGTRKGLSELERSPSDRKPGKRFFLSNRRNGRPRSDGVPGLVRKTAEGRTLSFAIHVERFANGAQPIVEVTLFEKRRHEVRFRTFEAEGSARIRQLTLSATMGNLARTRHLWLAKEPVHSVVLYRGYRGNGFVERGKYPLGRLHRTKSGDVVVAITPDEFDPSEVLPFAKGGWRCPVGWLAQYWRKPKGTFDPSLVCRVNGRRVYWRSRNPLPGGIAFENFELRETFRVGQEIRFGFERRSPAGVFGFGYDLPPAEPVQRKIPAAERDWIAEAGRRHARLVNGDFANGLDAWKAEPEPTPFRLYRAGEETRLTTFGPGRDADQGRLYQCFEVPADASLLRLYLHGGCEPERLRVNLWQGERLFRWMTARNHNKPFEVRFSLEEVRGEVVTLEVVDRSTAEWGFLGVHGIEVVSR